MVWTFTKVNVQTMRKIKQIYVIFLENLNFILIMKTSFIERILKLIQEKNI